MKSTFATSGVVVVVFKREFWRDSQNLSPVHVGIDFTFYNV